MFSSKTDRSGKIIVDSIHRDIHLSDREVQVIDTASFQRLRQLKQLQMGHVTYPNATHTRFAHSLGALGIMSRIITVAEKTLRLTKIDQENLRLASLLHDIGHYPYSHLMESFHKVILTEEFIAPVRRRDISFTPYPGHVQLGRVIITSQKDVLNAIGVLLPSTVVILSCLPSLSQD